MNAHKGLLPLGVDEARADVEATMTRKGLRVVMPSGEGCFYVDEADSEFMRHSYWRLKDDGDRGQRLTGNSTMSKIADLDPKPLLKWAARTNGIGIATIVGPILAGLREGAASPDELEWLSDHETIWTTLEDAELTFDKVREAKAQVGTNVHERAFQALAAGAPAPDLDELTEVEAGYAGAVMQFWLDHTPAPLLAEQIVLDLDLGVAGRLDYMGALEDRCGDELCPCVKFVGAGNGVIDAKTSGFIPASHHLQVAGYQHMAEHSGFGAADWGAILKLAEDGAYELIESEATTEEFVAAVALYRAVGRINREANKKRGKRKLK